MSKPREKAPRSKRPPQSSAEIEPNEGVLIRLSWASADEIETIYVNHLNINHSGPEFYLTFGELSLPPIMDPEEVPKELRIKPKVRLAIAPEAMLTVLEAIQSNVETYLEKREKGKK